jgi:hypothetical protein
MAYSDFALCFSGLVALILLRSFETFAALRLIVTPTTLPCALWCCYFAVMEFIQLFAGLMWVFSPGARFTALAQRQMRDDTARILARVRVRRVRAGYRPDRTAYLHRACCDVGELVQEVTRWGRSWPTALAVLRVAAERAWLHPEAAQFSFVPPLAKLAAEAFIVEQMMGEGLGGLEAFQDEGEWISVAESFDMLRPYEHEASSMVDTLLDGLVELFDSL